MSRLLFLLAAFVASCAAYKIEPLASYIQTKTYNLELELEKNGNFSGLVTIKFTTTSDTPRENKIVLNSEELEIVTAHLQDKNGKEESIVNYSGESLARTISLQLEQPLEKNSTYELKISYKGKIWSDRGMYKSRGYIMTNLNPIYARRIMPCFDSLDKKAMFTVVVISSDPYVISNMPIESTVAQGGKTRYTFKRTPKIPINRLFILSGPQPFVKYSNMRWGNATLYLYPGYESFKIFNEILSIANTTLLHNLWDKSGLEKLDILVVHDLSEPYFAGHGVVLLRKDLMEFDAGESTSEMKREAAFTILQAILEVYFGSVVSPINWQSNWLSSSIAKYLKYQAFNKDENWGDMNEFKLLDIGLEATSKRTEVALTKSFNDTEGLMTFLNGPYSTKGASLFSMMEAFLKPEEISNVLVIFMDKFKYSDGLTNMDLFSSLTALVKNLPVGADEFLQNWVYSASVAVVEITRDDVNVNVNQIYYKELILPISYTMKSRINYDPKQPGPLWILKDSGSAKIPDSVQTDEWVCVNTDGNVPMLTMYDDRSWYLLGQALRENLTVLSPSTRAKLVADAFRMAQAGKTSYTTVLHFLTYLDDETALAPWALAIKGFKEMYDWIYFTKSNSTAVPNLINLKPEFENYVTSRMVKIYKALGFEQTSGNREQDSLRREIVSAMCYFGYEPCKTSTLELFKKMNRTTDPYTPPNDMRSVIYCTGMSGVDKVPEWKKQYDILFKPELGYDILNIHMQVLACPDPVDGDTSYAMREYLSTIFYTPSFPITHIETAYKAIYNRVNHINQALFYLLDNMSRIKVIGSNKKSELLDGLKSKLWTDYHYQLLSEFLKKHETAAQTVKDSVQILQSTVKDRQNFIKNNMQAVHIGLTTSPGPDPPGPTPPTTPPTGTPTDTTNSTNPSPTGGSSGTPTTVPTTVAPASEGLSTGSISLIVVGVIVAIVLIGVILYFSCRNGGCCE